MQQIGFVIKLCVLCQSSFGPGSVVVLGMYDHVYHHACMIFWECLSKKRWCGVHIHDREYTQRGLEGSIVDIETQLDSFDVEHFYETYNQGLLIKETLTTINDNLPNTQFEQLIQNHQYDQLQKHCQAASGSREDQ